MRLNLLFLLFIICTSCAEKNNRVEQQPGPFTQIGLVEEVKLEEQKPIKIELLERLVAQFGSQDNLNPGHTYEERDYQIIKVETGDEGVPFIFCHFKEVREKTFVQRDKEFTYQLEVVENEAVNSDCDDVSVFKGRRILKDPNESFEGPLRSRFSDTAKITGAQGRYQDKPSFEVNVKDKAQGHDISLRLILGRGGSPLQPASFSKLKVGELFQSRFFTKVLEDQEIDTLNIKNLPIYEKDENGQYKKTDDVFVAPAKQ